CVYLTFLTVPSLKRTKVGQYINFCHNRGSIEFFVEGKKMTYEEIEVSREVDGEVHEAQLTEDFEFVFFKGTEGEDKYNFYVDKQSSERLKDIKVTFINESKNWWTVYNYDLNFDITKRDGEIRLKGTCYLNGEKIMLDEVVNETKKLYSCEIDLTK
ncbi:MAG: hypothetical protein IIU65_05460, partial [Clostridia bacterium]|nr:hypothetical protein [Clostridia bacterium]